VTNVGIAYGRTSQVRLYDENPRTWALEDGWTTTATRIFHKLGCHRISRTDKCVVMFAEALMSVASVPKAAATKTPLLDSGWIWSAATKSLQTCEVRTTYIIAPL
jgi:hypothetical protein